MWKHGEYKGFSWCTKVFDEGSKFGINNGKISKLWIQRKQNKEEAHGISIPEASGSETIHYAYQAEYIIDALTIFGNKSEIYIEDKTYGAMYVSSEIGEVVILPKKHADNEADKVICEMQ